MNPEFYQKRHLAENLSQNKIDFQQLCFGNLNWLTCFVSYVIMKNYMLPVSLYGAFYTNLKFH